MLSVSQAVTSGVLLALSSVAREKGEAREGRCSLDVNNGMNPESNRYTEMITTFNSSEEIQYFK